MMTMFDEYLTRTLCLRLSDDIEGFRIVLEVVCMVAACKPVLIGFDGL